MRSKLTAILIIGIAALSLNGCGGTVIGDNSDQSVDALGDRLDRLTVDGEWDSLFSITMPLVYGTQTDTVSKVCASLYNAQYWLYRESLDSVAHYLDIVQRNLDSVDGMGMEGMYYVLEGMYRMKSEWDFPGMVGMLLKSYDVYKELGEVANMAYPLINIVNFYYMRSDVRGLDYAREVYALVRDNSLSPYYQGVASMIMAEMLSLSDSPRDAWPYLRTADSLIRSEEYEPYYSIIDLLKADMSLLDGDSTAADSLYAVALEREAVTEPVVISLICLHYGRFCEDRGMLGKAAELYGKGLAISDRYANMELRNELQLHLADVSYELGDMKGSLSNYRASQMGRVRSQEWELNDLRMSYQEVLHKQEVQAKELDLVKSRRLVLVVVFVLVIVAVVSVFFIVLFRRQRRLNRTLVDQYRSYMQRTQQKQPAEEADRHLWEKVERMMNVDKLYLRKDLTLESMAQELATNRTYLSKAVNAFSGGNFSSYVDRFRIREAVGIIEARGGAVDLKELGPAVGYSSVTAFYRAFSKETGLSPGKYREEIQRRR